MEFFLPVIRTGLMFAPFIIIGFTVPFIFASYHRYGHISVTQWIIVVSFALYLFMVLVFAIFPLPTIEEVRALTTPTIQLQPLNSFNEFMTKSGFVWNNMATWWPAMNTFVFLEPILNMVMFIPFGIYLRYYFNRNWWQVILLSFLFSLFIEVMQYTGLFGVYPRAYRLFDVDDLITNTLGGWLGFVFAPILTWWLPTKTEMLKINYKKGIQVGYFRRVIAFALDWIMIIFITFTIKALWQMMNWPNVPIDPMLQNLYTYIGIVVGYFILLPAITRGRTVGKWVVQIAISSANHRGVNILKLLIRQVFLYGLLVPSFYLVWQFIMNFNTVMSTMNVNSIDPIALAKIVVPVVIVIIFIMDVVYKRVRGKETPVLLYENWSGTEEVNTIEKPRKVA